MAQNDKKFCLTLVSWELYLIWFWFLLPMLVLIQFFTLGHKKIGAQKIKTFYFQDKFYSLKAHVHYFTVLIYLPTSRAAKLLIVTHFTFTNLPWCSQSINSLIYEYSVQISSRAWSQLGSHFFVLPLPPPPQKNSVLPPVSCICRDEI